MMMLGTSFSSAQTDADNFYKSDLVSVEKVSFSNQYKMKVAGNLFLPKNMKEGDKYPAIIVGHPMGAVKEQSANLYATKMAERGFVTLSIDLSFWGESEGEPRNAVLPEVYAEDFSAAVDFLGTRPFVDRNLIGVIGICGSGSFAISAAKIDPRLKAIATISIPVFIVPDRAALAARTIPWEIGVLVMINCNVFILSSTMDLRMKYAIAFLATKLIRLTKNVCVEKLFFLEHGAVSIC